MNLIYLDFDYSEDTDGTGTFDAMASALPAQLPALQAEITTVLAWAHQHWPDACAPSEDGGEWQYDLHGVQEVSTPLLLTLEETTQRLHVATGTPTPPRTTLTLTISGHASFCTALRDAFTIS